MDMQQALRARILASADVTRLVAQRVYWLQRAQATALPAVVLQTISDVRDQHMRGFQSLRATRVRVDVWADSYGAARQVSEAVVAATVAEHRGNGVHFRRAQIEGPRDLLEDGQDTSTAAIYRCSTDLMLWWSSY